MYKKFSTNLKEQFTPLSADAFSTQYGAQLLLKHERIWETWSILMQDDHSIFFYVQKHSELDLSKGRGWFLNFLEAPMNL
jgi:hypothetical protein